MTKLIWMTGTAALLLLALSYIFFAFARAFSAISLLAAHPRIYALAATVLAAAPVFLLDKAGRTWMVVLLHLCAFLLLTQLAGFFLTHFLGNPPLWQFLYRWSVLPIVLTAAVITYGYFNMTNIIRTEYTVTTEKEIRPAGYTIALIADTHFGNATTLPLMRDTMARVAADAPDLVLLGGDIVDENTTKEEMESLFPVLGEIPAPLGTFYVYGNHDRLIYAPRPAFTVAELDAAITGSGIQILADDTARLTEDFLLAGRRDRTMGQMPVSELLANADKNDFLLLLDHQPYDFAEKETAGADLTLSGHTHAGQIFPAGFFTAGDLNYGEKILETMTAIVTSGASGWGFPLRTSKHSEYVIVHVVPKRDA